MVALLSRCRQLGEPSVADAASPSDELPNPLEDKRRESREVAISQILSGQATPEKRGTSTVVKIGKKGQTGKGGDTKTKQARVDQYVELSREKTDKIFVVLAEFGNERHPSYPDQDTDPNTPGPDHASTGRCTTQIPAPDRTEDNSTVWQPDYSQPALRGHVLRRPARAESLKTYYEKQSSGRYSVDGQVTDWVKVPYNEARYGRSNGYPCAGNVCSNTWYLIQDAINPWVADQQAAGQTDAQIKADLASYDQWDRYDYDGDGDFNEPDGYIDHFQIVHAGGDQADGDPYPGRGRDLEPPLDGVPELRPAARPCNQNGGTQIGDHRPVGRATTRSSPRTAASRVFAHEYGHDLGLPDHYDTAGGGTRQRGQLVDAHGAEPRSAPSDQGIGTAPPTSARGTSCSSAGWTTRSSSPARTRRSTSARTSTTAPRRRASSWCCRRSRSPPTRRARRRDQAVVVRRGRRLRRHAHPLGHAARRHADAELPGALEHRGLRPRRVRLRLRRGRRRHRASRRSPATSPRPPRATASTATRRRWMPATFDLSRLRRQDGLAAVPLHDRRCGRARRDAGRLLRRRHQA